MPPAFLRNIAVKPRGAGLPRKMTNNGMERMRPAGHRGAERNGVCEEGSDELMFGAGERELFWEQKNKKGEKQWRKLKA